MKKHSILVVGLLAATTAMPGYAAADSDAEIAALKAQLEILTKRLNAMEAERAVERKAVQAAQASAIEPSAGGPAPANVVATPAVAGQGEPVVGGSLPGSFKIPGTQTSIKFGGFVKADAIYDAGHGYGNQFANFAAIPLEGSAKDRQDGEFNAHARNTRLNMQTSTPTSFGELKTFIELDFFGNSSTTNANTTNGEGLQLRQAYGEVNGVLAGQTWTNFADMAAYPESLDYVGPVGLTFVRQTQLRYTDTLDSNFGYSVALEAPNTDFTATDGSSSADLSDTPDLTGQLTYKDAFGHLALRGMARKLNATVTATGAEDEALGWGVGVSGRIKTFDKDSFAFQAVYGDGLGRYLFEAAIGNQGSTYAGNELDAQVAYGGYATYQHYWADEWRSNFIAGYSVIDNNASLAGSATANKEIMSGHVNLIWSPTPTYRVGLEYMHGWREVESGLEGDLDRLQASFIYNF